MHSMALIVIVVHNLSAHAWEVVTTGEGSARDLTLCPQHPRDPHRAWSTEEVNPSPGSWEPGLPREAGAALPAWRSPLCSLEHWPGCGRCGEWWQRDQPRSGLALLWSSMLGHSGKRTWVMVRGAWGSPWAGDRAVLG